MPRRDKATDQDRAGAVDADRLSGLQQVNQILHKVTEKTEVERGGQFLTGKDNLT